MKTLILIMITISSCNTVQQHSVDGIYVAATEGGYSMAEDTLVLQSSGPDLFSITRKTGFRRKQDGRLLPKEYQTEYLTGNYDAAHHTLYENKKGLLLICTGAAIQLGNSMYHKISRP